MDHFNVTWYDDKDSTVFYERNREGFHIQHRAVREGFLGDVTCDLKDKSKVTNEGGLGITGRFPRQRGDNG